MLRGCFSRQSGATRALLKAIPCYERAVEGNPVLREDCSRQSCATRRPLKAILCYERAAKAILCYLPSLPLAPSPSRTISVWLETESTWLSSLEIPIFVIIYSVFSQVRVVSFYAS